MELLTNFLTYVVPFLIVLTVVVFVHELGHYLVARWNDVRVEVFSIGFGTELFGFNDRNGTRWKLSALPLGGYVKMHGDADASSSTTNPDAIGDADSFTSKTVWQRMAIIAAGPIANFIFAIIALAMLFAIVGQPFTPAEVGEVQPDSAAAEAGLQPDDRILSVDGEPVESFEQLQTIVRDSPDVPLLLVIERAGEELEVEVTPRMTEIEDERFNQTHQVGLIGIARSGMEFKRSNPATALIDGFAETYRMIVGTLGAIGEMIAGNRTTEELGGPILIAQMSGEMAKSGLFPAILFTAILSINLGLINLFPIPILDGGHLVMLSIEAARGKPLRERSQEIAFRFGLALVLSLMVFATWNDLVRLDVLGFFSGLIS